MSDDRFSKRLLTTILSVATILILLGLWMLGPSKTKTSQDSLINEAAGRYGVDANLVKAVIQVESGFDPRAVGKKGEKGLMQLMPDIVTRYGVVDPFDPRQNIDAGTHYLADLLKKYNGNTELALTAYNGSKDYAPKVLAVLAGGPQRQVAVTVPTQAERVIETIAPVGRWSKNVQIPLLHWFRIVPEGKIRIRLWNGKEMDSEPGNDTWFGDNILDANFRFQSREEQDVKVKILMRPK